MAGDIGAGTREIRFLFGMYKKLRNEFTGVLTGKRLAWGGRLNPVNSKTSGYPRIRYGAGLSSPV